MPTKIDKIIVTNIGLLKAKYKPQGVGRIQAAIKDLIKADKSRGLQTVLVALDDALAMGKLSAKPVKTAGDPRQNKTAIDAIYRAAAPDYLMLLGSYDVIPHQDLKNPLYTKPSGDDPDRLAYGDIPYACEHTYSQDPADFVGSTRVVGRLPDITGATDPAYLVKLLTTAARYRTLDAQTLRNYFAITAQIWEQSTQLSLTNTFGNDQTLEDVPPRNFKWAANLIRRRSHFFNCHGAPDSPQFYGQPASGKEEYPVSLDAAYINGKIAAGTVAAAECCYGGQLYPLSATQNQLGMCNTYLFNGAYGFFASTTIAYGPSKGNAQADLLCQYFLQNVLAGASLGRAVLEARQKFVRTASPPDPSDLKTLAQFILYGDPSITLLKVAQGAAAPAGSVKALAFKASRVDRHDRRRILFRQGLSLGENVPVPRKTRTRPSKGVLAALRGKARDFKLEPGAALSFIVRHPAKLKAMPKNMLDRESVPTAFHVLFADRKEKTSKRKDQPAIFQIAAVVGKEVNGRLVSVTKIHSR